MIDNAKTGSPVQKACTISIMAFFLTVGGVLHVGEASKASAQEIDTTTYCYHFHNWALSGTTGVDSSLCQNLDTADQEPVYQDEFCFHSHKFALNQTSIIVGNASVVEWCNDYHQRANPLTWGLFNFHYHTNAGTGTTGPVQ